MEQSDFDILIVGGGAAGFFGAIRAAEAAPHLRIAILERGGNVLEKVRISGGGRCNLTHACFDPAELVQFYPRGSKELRGPFHQFACGDTLAWYDERGVSTKIEPDGRIFPTSDSSQTVIDCLMDAARGLGVQILPRQRVERLDPPADARTGQWMIRTKHQRFTARRLLITTGSNPAVWKELERLGHRIVRPVPSLFTFNIDDQRLHELAGISLPWVQIGYLGDRLQAEGPLLITHWGLSGPAVLRLSAWGARTLHETGYRFRIALNWINQPTDRAITELDAYGAPHPKRRIAAHPLFDLPQRLWQRLLQAVDIDPKLQWAQLPKATKRALARELTGGIFQVSGKSTFKEEFVTAGGVDLREVDFRRFQSKRYPTLFFAGEVLDIDAITGGFNFQAAWTGGWIAGDAIVQGVE